MIENEYGIKTKPASPGNLQANSTIDILHQELGNLIRTYNLHEIYVDDADPFMGILEAASFVERSTYHRTKEKTPGQLVFGRYMILTINHVADWRYTSQRKQTQINKDAAHENNTRTDHDYRVGDKVMTEISSAYKYETPFRCPCENFRTWTNGKVTLGTGAVTHIINIRNIKPYNDEEVE